MKICHLIITTIALVAINISVLPGTGLALEDTAVPYPNSGSKANNLFSSPESFHQELNTLIAGQAIDVVRMKDVSSSEIGSISNGTSYLSFSYEGSGGLLGFSSGYIYSADNENSFLVNNTSERTFAERLSPDTATNLYMGLNLTRSIPLSRNVDLGLSAGVIYLEDIYNYQDDGTVSLLFVMPLEISNSLTIAPKMHWSRPLTRGGAENDEAQLENDNTAVDSGSFYGGVSISFAY